MGFDLTKVGTALTDRMGLFGLKVRNASPEILLGVGTIGLVGAIVTAAFAGKKQDDIMEDHFTRLEKAKKPVIVAEDGTEIQRTENEIKSAVRKEYCTTIVKTAINFAPTAACAVISEGSFVSMHNIQARNLTAAVGAYTGLQEYVRRYEANNIKLNGIKSHQMCKYGYEKVTEVDENGDRVEKLVPKTGKAAIEDIAKIDTNFFWFIGKDNSAFSGFANTDVLMAQNAEKELRRLVNDRGWAVLNDFADIIQAERTVEGMRLGWVRGGNIPTIGWNAPVNNKILAGYNDEDWVFEFNVDGDVYAFLDRQEKAFAELGKKRMIELKEQERKG